MPEPKPTRNFETTLELADTALGPPNSIDGVCWCARCYQVLAPELANTLPGMPPGCKPPFCHTCAQWALVELAHALKLWTAQRAAERSEYRDTLLSDHTKPPKKKVRRK